MKKGYRYWLAANRYWEIDTRQWYRLFVEFLGYLNDPRA